MADHKPQRERISETHVLWKWGDVGVGVASGDTCVPVQVAGHNEITVSAKGGTWGSGSLAWHGTLEDDGATGYVALTDSARTPIAMTADALSEVLQNVVYAKPVLTGTGASGLFFSLLTRL